MISTRVAKNLWGENMYFGHRTLADLLGHETLTGLMFMAAIGRRPTDDEREVFDTVAVIMTSADGRIWPLKLGRLVSSYGGTLAGWCASLLTMEGPRLGPWTTGYSAQELVELRAQVGERIDDEEAVVCEARAFFERKRRVVGLGVPLRERDERYVALEAWVLRTGRDKLPHWRLHVALAAHGKRVANLGTNILLGLAAVLLDLGDYTPAQISALVTFVNQNVFAANALEAAQQRSPEMQRLPDDCVLYVGPAARISPRAAAERRRVEPVEPIYTDDALAGA
jgi:hypothetical protein